MKKVIVALVLAAGCFSSAAAEEYSKTNQYHVRKPFWAFVKYEAREGYCRLDPGSEVRLLRADEEFIYALILKSDAWDNLSSPHTPRQACKKEYKEIRFKKEKKVPDTLHFYRE